MNTDFNKQNPRSIQKMFNQIAEKYDQANTVLSFGIHHFWKKKFVKRVNPLENQKILDCATGTGDIAFLISEKAKNKACITGIDFSDKMLEVAKKRALNKFGSKKNNIEFSLADIESLPFTENTFDTVTISFGIRNVRDLSKGLNEIFRVLKPGGKLFILEFGQPENSTFASIYSFYSNVILPELGGMISGKKEAYRYLNKTSLGFPSGPKFCELAKKQTSFKTCKSESLSLGIAYIYTLQK